MEQIPSTRGRYPRSEARSAGGFATLLTAVDVDRPLGLQFNGRLVRPGGSFDTAALPHPAVLLEYAGRVRVSSERSRYAFQSSWRLWRFDFRAGTWISLAHMLCDDASYSVDFAHIAEQVLGTRPTRIPVQSVIRTKTDKEGGRAALFLVHPPARSL